MILLTFYRGFLYALREHRTQFVINCDDFHDAFRVMLEKAIHEPLFKEMAEHMLRNFDPVFGVFPEAIEMLFFGEICFIICTCNPQAQFKISMKDAMEELEQIPEADTFRYFAACFHEELIKKNRS